MRTTRVAPATAATAEEVRPAPATATAVVLDPQTAYRALAARDRRFDGRIWFGVRTTGIYCRPVCPAATPKPENVRLFAAPAAAVAAGYRACRRCRPDAAPGTRAWDHRGDLAARALRLLADGVADDDGVAGLARRLHVSERHLHRVLVAEIGAGPQQLAISRRAQTARLLIDQTDLPLTDIAFAAGFASLRQFNDVMRREFGAPPSQLRRRVPDERQPAGRPGLSLRLPWREPYDAAGVGAWLAARAVTGLEIHEGGNVPEAWRHRRSLQLPHGVAEVAVGPGGGHLSVTATVADLRDVRALVARVRAWLDLDLDPASVGDVLGADPALAPLMRARPGLRVTTFPERFEGVVRTVVGQQVSTRAAQTLTARLVGKFGDDVDGSVLRAFPTPSALAAAGPDVIAAIGLPRARARCLHAIAVAATDGTLQLSTGVPREDVLGALGATPGVGPWTRDYVALRVLGDPDAFPETDLVIRRSAAAQGIPAAELRERSRRWSPWRAYAAQHLWAAATNSTHRNRAQAPGDEPVANRSGGQHDGEAHP